MNKLFQGKEDIPDDYRGVVVRKGAVYEEWYYCEGVGVWFNLGMHYIPSPTLYWFNGRYWASEKTYWQAVYSKYRNVTSKDLIEYILSQVLSSS